METAECSPRAGCFGGIDRKTDMGGILPAEGFLRHKGLILVAAGGAVIEAGLLTLVAPAARPVAPQATALPALAAYHDLRWLFADGQSWIGFAAVFTAVLLARSAMDMALLRLAWPRELRAPRLSRAFWSCTALTALAWLLLSPAVTLAFGVAVLPFSWPFLAALPIMLGIVAALSHGGVIVAWWRRLPPLRSVLWLLASFLVLSASAAVIAHLGDPGGAGRRGRHRPGQRPRLVRARRDRRPPAPAHARVGAGQAAAQPAVRPAGRGDGDRPRGRHGPADVHRDDPAAAALASRARSRAASLIGDNRHRRRGAGGRRRDGRATRCSSSSGWGSSCCDAGNGLHAMMPGTAVRQFSYLGMNAKGDPLRSGPGADDLPLPELGDRMAAQLMELHAATGRPVDVVAESEGTLGLYAMLDRHPGCRSARSCCSALSSSPGS